MKVWAIKNKDGLYYENCWFNKDNWTVEITSASKFKTVEETKYYITKWKLKDCNPVKVKIEEVKE